MDGCTRDVEGVWVRMTTAWKNAWYMWKDPNAAEFEARYWHPLHASVLSAVRTLAQTEERLEQLSGSLT